MKIAHMIVALLATACALPPAAGSSPSPTSPLATSAPSSTASAAAASPATPPLRSRVLAAVPHGAVASPDGRWIAAIEQASRTGSPNEPGLLLFSADGTLVRRQTGIYVFRWLPDSSGVFVATSVGQRAPDLTILELDGRLVSTQIHLADEALSSDGKWIVAEHQEGCCVAVDQREIRVSSRDGRVTRTLVRSEAPEMQPVTLFGIDAADRVFYRDGASVMRVPLAGGTPAVIASASDLMRTTGASTSPDRRAMLLRGYQPDRWYVLANERLVLFDSSQGEPITEPYFLRDGPAVIWIGPHTLLTRAVDGTLSAWDTVTATRRDFSARLVGGDTVLAHENGAVLVLRRSQPVLIDLTTGAVRESGLNAGVEASSTRCSTLSGGGFLLSTPTATYRLD